ncbi:hypothetical protein F5Y00DRAFT_257224 [Daldinia vernicosa]|uniref:uncharacterized protein n=1 Tax=Daldinia vernicosa TaxID=114800 RepID=UPI002007DAB7|nr:uncharacterized protein F5Y00DRAFT_257224 [Daldinia vernicosa]KAI0853924.1 hypothetical protein F5Y00DRAFT_257224 [Daldinia vernicosa]
MAASSSSLVDIGDPSHPFAHITQQNHKSPFLSLPLEIRLMIYEFAVAVNKPVRPRQVTARSNKFVWDPPLDQFPNRSVLRLEEGKSLVVGPLSRTCRSIYQELEKTPVFYRVNSFEFYYAPDLHAFLAAILPKRLALIRTIRLIPGTRPNLPVESWGAELHPRTPNYQRTRNRAAEITHILTLLTQCKDLRELSLILQQDQYGDMVNQAYGWDKLAAYFSYGTPAFINMNGFDIFMRLASDGEEFQLKKALDHPDLTQSFVAKNILSTIVHGLDERKKAFALKAKALKAKAQEGESYEEIDLRPQWFKDMENQTAIEAAIIAAPVDFTGENRIAQDLHQIMSNRVSSRTRRKGQSVDSMGVLRREEPKYNLDGLLTWWYSHVTGIRWSDSRDVELELNYPGRTPESSWESFYVLPKDRHGEQSIINFFKGVLKERHIDVEATLQRVRSIPSPLDIAKLAGGLNQYIGKDTMYGEKTSQTVKKGRIRAWTHCDDQWNQYIVKLEMLVDKRKKEATKAASKATKKTAK